MVATVISPQFKMFKQKTNQKLTSPKKFYGVSYEEDFKSRLDFTC